MKEKNSILIAASISSFLTPFMGSSVNIALPAIGQSLNLGAVSMTWVSTAYLLSTAVFLVPLGKAADSIGRRKVFIWGIMIFSVSSLLAAVAWSPAVMLASRAIHGLGSAMIFSTGVAMVASVFPKSERGRSLGITAAAVYLGLSAGPFAGGLLAQHLGWRSIFLVLSAASAVLAAHVFFTVKHESQSDSRGRFDFTGSLLYAVSLPLIIYGFSRLPGRVGAFLTLAGAALLAVFIYFEKRSDNPVLDIKLFSNNTAFAMSNFAALINYSATFSVTFLLSLYLQFVKGYSASFSGIILISQPLIMSFISPVTGRLSDRIEPKYLSSAGMAVSAAGLIPMAFISQSTSILFIASCLVVQGIGFGLFASPNTNAIMSSVHGRHLGTASATMGTMRLVGQMMSMGFATLIFALFLGQSKISADNIPAMLSAVRTAFSVSAALCLCGIYFSYARGNVRD